MKVHFGETKLPACLRFEHEGYIYRDKHGERFIRKKSVSDWPVRAMWGMSFGGMFFGVMLTNKPTQ